jgi:hypothetical protein
MKNSMACVPVTLFLTAQQSDIGLVDLGMITSKLCQKELERGEPSALIVQAKVS